MDDDDFPVDEASPVIKGTLWVKPRPKAGKLSTKAGKLTRSSAKAEGPAFKGGGEAIEMQYLLCSKCGRKLKTVPIIEERYIICTACVDIRDTAERLRIEARQGHRKYKGPNFYSQFTRRAPQAQVQAKDMKPETTKLAENLARMMPRKGKRETCQ